MGYNIPVFEYLSKLKNDVHVVHWDHKKLSKFKHCSTQNIKYYKRSNLKLEDINNIANNVNPDITVVSGWMDNDYLKVAKIIKSNGNVVICCLDNHWTGNFKQNILKYFVKIGLFKLFFSHVWVSGLPQYNFAKKIGINDSNILFDMYSADTQLFDKSFKNYHKLKKSHYPHRFIFVGRLEDVKGIKYLVAAWKELEKINHNWKLTIIGNGKYLQSLKKNSTIEVLDFLQPNELIKIVKDTGCYILPSLNEPWGVVVHEFAAAGLPLLLSDKIGSKSSFLIDKYNGFTFKSKSTTSLKNAISKVISTNDKKLYKMGKNSRKLSKRISTETSVANLLSSIIKK
tara:strand:+ start:1839 stop:2864 length:1026 start_codon:yes stop_codon:yes gene_type:complete